jgi:Icc-related predicted phosphoesterase
MNTGKIKIVLAFIFIALLGSCEDIFEYSPYAANVKDSYKDIGIENLEKILEQGTEGKEEFKFAVFADSHYSYHELDEAVVNVNSRKDIDFVIVNGDIADHGYLKEYELFHETMDDLKIPYLTTIGNHDYRSNGEDVYKEMYGNRNYTIKYNNCLFVLWDDVFWESNKTPDFNWLEENLEEGADYEKIFVVCHIPPFDAQFDDESELLYSDLMNRYNVNLSIHGHIHRFHYSEYYNDGVNYMATEAIIDKEYVIVTVKKDEIVIEAIKY